MGWPIVLINSLYYIIPIFLVFRKSISTAGLCLLMGSSFLSNLLCWISGGFYDYYYMNREVVSLLLLLMILVVLYLKENKSENLLRVFLALYGLAYFRPLQELTTILLSRRIPTENLLQLERYLGLVLLLPYTIFLKWIAEKIARRMDPEAKEFRYWFPWVLEAGLFFLSLSTDLLFDLFITRKMGHGMFYLIWILLFALLTYLNQCTIRRHEQYKKRMEERENVYQAIEGYSGQVELLYGSLRSFRHDYSNILLTLRAYLENHDYEGLEHYFYEKLVPYEKPHFDAASTVSQLANFPALEVRGVLSDKLLAAQEAGIRVLVEVRGSINLQNMNPIDLARILGIFLDNAIEGALGCDNPWITLKVRCESAEAGEMTEVILQNSRNPEPSNMKTAVNSRQTSVLQGLEAERKMKPEHGIGLKTVASILKYYPNCLWETQKEDTVYAQRLVIAEESA